MKNSVLFLLVMPLLLFAQPKGYVAMKDKVAFNLLLKNFSQNTTTLSTDFVQTKSMKMLKNNIQLKGKMSYAKVSKIRIEYFSPKASVIVMNNGKTFVKENGKVANLSNNVAFKRINQLILGSLNGDIAKSKDFSVQYFENATTYYLELTPVMKSMQAYISTIILVFDRKDMTLQKMELNEKNNDKTWFDFSNKKINETIDNKLFELK